MENAETSGWLEFSRACIYINDLQHKKLLDTNAEIGRLLNHMINNPEKY